MLLTVNSKNFSLVSGRLCLLVAAFFLLPVSALVAQEMEAKAESESSVVELDTITIEGHALRSIGPMQGLQLEKEQIPANVQSLSSKEIKESLSTSLGDLMNSKLQSVNVNDYAGNPFQMDITFRGFSASPQLGTPQGLSVFVDGVRVNEPFGDIVNWDLIPLNAIGGMDVFPGSNPLFGLNTLGGALSLRTKNGFDDTGADVRFQGGSWNRKKGEISVGWNNGAFGAFASFTGFDEEGWRVNSPSSVNQGFARLDWRGDDFSLRFSTLAVGNNLIGNGLIPTSLYNQNPSSVFTSPDQTENELQQFTLGGEFFINDEWSLTGQIYRRDSNRKSLAGDMYEDFEDMDRGVSGLASGKTDGTTGVPGQPVCQYQDVNHDNIPDYYVTPDRNGDGFTDDQDFIYDSNGNQIIDPKSVNVPLTPDNSDFVSLMPGLNGAQSGLCGNVLYKIPEGPKGFFLSRNGKFYNVFDEFTPEKRGWIPGTPIGVLSKTDIDQNTDGASLQLNYNADEHKFMIGGSIDAATTDFVTSQRLGLIDANRRVYSDPANIDPIYLAAKQDIRNNSFLGKSTTFSGYFSETYSPLDNLHLNFSGRFNKTRVTNNVRSRTRVGFAGLHTITDVHNAIPNVILCPSTDPVSCPTKANYNIDGFFRDVVQAANPTSGLGKYSETPTQETFNFTSFNPSLGFSYLPFKDWNVPYKSLDMFFNWSQGTRVPSSVELGCAYDGTLVRQDPNNPNSPLTPKSLATIGGACTLPTALSGDPFLPQIKANNYEFGLRGKLFEAAETGFFRDFSWNASVYRTDLKNDIYLVGITADRSFFDTIGATRRQGIEFGFSGKAGIADFSVNYGYTDATFQNDLFMLSPHNSSAEYRRNTTVFQYDPVTQKPLQPITDMIHVKSGGRMPGVPLHNINASLNFHLTPKWDFGITMIAHSGAFVRGNENNQHQQGAIQLVEQRDFSSLTDPYKIVQGRQFKDAGSVPGYAIFNLKTRYKVFEGFSLFALVNNLFDRRYVTAGRLGINPFSPSENGAIGPSGWNYNSGDWLNSTFIGPGAPRAIWIGFDYRFDK
jgi:outer membrane receptor protein involved in Fe transport